MPIHKLPLPVAPRQIMYAARDYIQRRTGKELKPKYFSQTLLIDYMANNLEQTANWDIAWDARGNLIKPHTKRVIPLSTLAVRKYVEQKAWRNRYGVVLFCEKEGFQPLFEAVKLGERYDIAIMSTKGTSTTAARTLLDALIADGVPVYCIRDFDFAGFNIAGTLARDTHRYAWASKGAVDFGLRLADVKAYGLPSERVFYKNGKRLLTAVHQIRAKIAEPLRGNGATEAEMEFLLTHRVELNAFTSGQLVEWLEAKFAEHGVSKVVPDDGTLVDKARGVARQMVVVRILDEKTEEIAAEVGKLTTDGLATEIRASFAKDPALPWDSALDAIVRRRFTA